MINEAMKDKNRKAMKTAEQKHKGQVRKFGGGEPYVNHPKRVADIVRKYKDSKEINRLVQAAYLHDTLEDTNMTTKEMKKKFGSLVVSLVKELTSDKEAMEKAGGKAEYLKGKTQNMSSWALVIKLADRMDNVRDFDKAPKAFVEKYTKETNKILDNLEQNRKLSGTQKRMIADIRKTMAKHNPVSGANREIDRLTNKLEGLKDPKEIAITKKEIEALKNHK